MPHSSLELLETAEELRRAGENPAAEEVFRRAVQTDPGAADAWADLGCFLSDSHRYNEAIEALSHALRILKPDRQPAIEAADELKATADLLTALAALKPDWGRGQFSLACALEQLKDYERARAHIQNTIRLAPDLEVGAYSLLASMDWMQEKWNEGVAAAERAIASNPDYSFAHVMRGRCCLNLGETHEGCESFRRALALRPHPRVHSSLLFEMNNAANTTPEAVYAEAWRWNSVYAEPLARQIRPHTNVPDPERPLRIGYVSPDLYNHAIMKFLPPVFEHHDRSRFEVLVYAVGATSDEFTEQLRSTVEHYIPVQYPYDEFAARIRRDEIDILVDLAGHTMGPSYLAFALKPAPVQVSWLGTLCTTGMTAMDYYLGNAHVPHPDTEHLFSETVYRLPRNFFCYRPFAHVPLTAPPYLTRGYVTFGSFNSYRKIHRDVVKLWSAILHLAPQSKLLLKYESLDNAQIQTRLRRWFEEDGIPGDRLIFEGSSKVAQYLEAYSRVDVALDTFPYNGGTTTLDTLWMGVPVVTLAGRLPVQCGGKNLLTAVGLSDYVANTPEEYLKTALFLAGTVPKYPRSRFNLRAALQSSPLMDEAGFVRDLEQAYRNMWRIWCGKAAGSRLA